MGLVVLFLSLLSNVVFTPHSPPSLSSITPTFDFFFFYIIPTTIQAITTGVVMGGLGSVLFAAVAVAVVAVVVHFYYGVWRRTAEIRRKLRAQGVTGPPPSLLYGNLPEMQEIQLEAAAAAMASPPHHASVIVAHDYTSTLFPYFVKWRKQYGIIYYYYYYYFVKLQIKFPRVHVVHILVSIFSLRKEI